MPFNGEEILKLKKMSKKYVLKLILSLLVLPILSIFEEENF